MEKLKEVLEYLNGKKTNIGAFLLTLALVIPIVDQQLLVDIWGITVPVWMDSVVETLQWGGGVFSGVGLFHKALKAKKDGV